MTINHRSIPQWIATVAAVLLWAVGSAYMTQSELLRPERDWVLIVATPLIWAVVIVLPIIAHHAIRERRLFAAVMLFVAALVGSAYTLSGTIARQAEVQATRTADASHNGGLRSTLLAEFDAARVSRDDADADAKRACGKSAYSDNCKAKREAAKTAAAAVTSALGLLGEIGPEKDPAAGDKVIAQAIAFLPGVRSAPGAILPHVQTFRPALLGLVLEIGALALGFYGAAPGRAANDNGPRRVPSNRAPLNGGKLREDETELPAPDTVQQIAQSPVRPAAPALQNLDEDTRLVVGALIQADGPVTLQELADLMGCVKGEASTRKDAALKSGLVREEVDQIDRRRKQISLAAALA